MNGLFVLVSGLPATGKTTLAKRISADLGIPLFSRDSLKDVLVKSGLAENRKVGSASVELLYLIASEFINKRASGVFESNFHIAPARRFFLDALQRSGASAREIHCVANPKVSAHRFASRATADPGYRGVSDLARLTEFDEGFFSRGSEGVLTGWPSMTVDTSEVEKIDYQRILEFLLAAIIGR